MYIFKWHFCWLYHNISYSSLCSIMIMENFDNLIRCYPFSSVFYVGCKQCCNQMNLISVLSHSFKCQTCLLWRDAPAGVAPIFPANECTDEHIANNHITICLVCQSKNFQGTWCKDKALAHILIALSKQHITHPNHSSVHLVFKHYFRNVRNVAFKHRHYIIYSFINIFF